MLLAGAEAGIAAGANPRFSGAPPPLEAGVPVTDAAELGAWLRQLAGRYRVEGSVEVRMRATVPESGSESGESQSSAQMILDRIRTESGYSDEMQLETVRGKGDCVGVGNGPGVQCVLQVTWNELQEVVQPSRTERGGVFNLPGGKSNLAPSMGLFGLEPGQSTVRYLLVDSAGLAEGAAGNVVGHTATFRTPCANGPAIMAGLRPPPVRQSGQPAPEPPPTSCDKAIRIVAEPESQVVYLLVDIELDGVRKTTYTLTMRRVPQES